MTEPILSRRHFNHSSLISLSAAAAMPDGTAAAQQQATSHAATRRDVTRQELPGEPLRDISLIEVTYPPATGSPPHLHANGVMAFVVSGSIRPAARHTRLKCACRIDKMLAMNRTAN